MGNDKLLSELRDLLKHKKGKAYYGERLNISINEVEDLLRELREETSSLKYYSNNYSREDGTNVPHEQGIQEKVENIEKGTTQIKFLHTIDVLSEEEIWKETKMDPSKWKFVQIYHKKYGRGFLYTANFRAKDEKDEFEDDLIPRLEEIFINNPIRQRKVVKRPRTIEGKALFVYLADDHAGIDFKSSIFDSPYDAHIYNERLQTITEEISNLEGEFDKLFIVNLGDELDGWDSYTTRGGHKIDSLSNKEQFDIYTTARKLFYDEIMESDRFPEVEIINVNNSNHSGKSYSYIVNKALEFYLDARYDNIIFSHQEKVIEMYEYGIHGIAITHGKDQKYMKAPMPLNLDNKTDLWLMDFYRQYDNSYFSLVKGDLHSYSVNMGKSGRYVNVPSICGGSNWIEHNFGSSRAGALLEIVEKNSKNIMSIPIWF